MATFDESDPRFGQDPQGSGGGGVPSGYRINPQTGQLEPIPAYQPSTTLGQTPWTAGSQAPSSSPQGMHWDSNMANFVPDVAALTTNDDGGGGGGGGGNPFNLTAPFTGTAPAVPNGTSYLPPTPSYTAPTFAPPAYQKPPSFELPSFAQAADDPGYQFSLKAGLGAVNNSQAARGLTNTGGTAKALGDYATASAGTQYSNVLNRLLQQYLTNVQTQYNTPYDYAYRSAVDSFAPQMAQFSANVGAGNLGYSTQAQAGQRNQEFNYNALWDQYTNAQNYDRTHKLDVYNMISPVLSA